MLLWYSVEFSEHNKQTEEADEMQVSINLQLDFLQRWSQTNVSVNYQKIILSESFCDCGVYQN